MKVVCVYDKTKVSTGLFSSEMRKSDELTEGKTYEVLTAIVADNVTLTDRTVIEPSDTKFLLFNDKGEWDTYNPRRFRPV